MFFLLLQMPPSYFLYLHIFYIYMYMYTMGFLVFEMPALFSPSASFVALLHNYNSHTRIAGYAKEVSWLYPEDCQCKATNEVDGENKAGISNT